MPRRPLLNSPTPTTLALLGPPAPQFASFWMGGFEGADHVNGSGIPLDMAAVNGHVEQLEDDHARAAASGLRTVRETIGWRLTETAPGRFDFERVRRIAASARRHGLQVLWTLMHYGTPPDVRLTDDAAIDRFAAFAAEVARALGPWSDAPPVYNPINEISFLAWAVSHTDMVHPYRHDPLDGSPPGDSTASGYEVKRRLVRMALAGIEAIRRVDPRARILHVEPLVHVAPPVARPELAALSVRIADFQWQAWDLLAGLAEPGLGGTPAALDIVGVNHYHSSQWEAETEDRLWWHRRDPRRLPFRSIVADCWTRYRRPMVLAETSHCGEGRAAWLDEMAAEVAAVRADGIPLDGLCLYPLIDRPDWDDLSQWHDSGLWDVDRRTPAQRRVLCADYAAALGRWRACLPAPPGPRPDRPVIVVFSHLRWDFLFQRPQQLMTRLAATHRVLFVEEPLPLPEALGPARLDSVSCGPDLELLLPRTSLDVPGFDDTQCTLLQPLLAAELARRGIVDWTAWLCTPLALPLVTGLAPRQIVYDCMDEMSGFANAPAATAAREAELLHLADHVLAAGPSLATAKALGSGRRVHCIGNGVDAAAFAPASLDGGSAQATQARRRQPTRPGAPRLGYCGAVDERIDLALVAALADARPDCDIVMAGPVLKIDAGALPLRPNLHWIGHQPQVRVPHLVASWDVCLIPFLETAVTRTANPVKTFEYLAAGKPVVATPVPDLADLPRGAVRVTETTEAFVDACAAALRESPAEREGRLAAAQAAVGASSWDDRVAEIVGLLAGERTEARSNEGAV